MNLLSPIKIQDAMIGAATTIAEPAAGETVWVSGSAYVEGDLRIRTTTHKVYTCVKDHTGIAALPENDPTRWLEKSPTQRWAPFDTYTNTAARSTGLLTYVLSPGYFNAVAAYGVDGVTYSITVKDDTGGAVIYSKTGSLSEDPLGWYEYLFSPLKVINRLIIKDLPIRPNAELTVTITGATVALGMLNVGDYVSLIGEGDWGGTEHGAMAEPISHSYVKTNPDGTTSIIRRTSATGMRATVILPRSQADQALLRIQGVLDVPVSWVATDAPGYTGLNVFGLGSATVSYDGFSQASLNINVKGMI